MPRHIDPPKTIAQQGGLEAYLNATADRHNGLKYRHFMRYIRKDRKHPVPKVVIAEDFGVSTRTIYGWLKIHAAEEATTALLLE